jgi:multiple sugar transport system ATP-binding protein
MTLGDRVAVMRAGVLQQVGTPQDLYNNPENLFVAGFIGSPAMNFMPARVEGDTVKLPMADVRLSPEARERLGSGARGGQLIAGVRPEHFEDAHLVGEQREHGATFRARIDVLESMGSELYAYFSVESEALDSEELRELAEDAGTTEVPGGGGDGQVVARLDASSDARQGQEKELWLDASQLHFFDLESGRSLTSREAAAAPA